MEYKVTTNELYHHGIKGQKWGIRRFQKEKDSLNFNRSTNTHKDYTEAHSNKKINELSNKELGNRLKRLNMEQQYKKITKNESKGKKFVDGIMKTTATLTALVSTNIALYNNMERITKILKRQKLGAGSTYNIDAKKKKVNNKKVNNKTSAEQKKLARDMLKNYDMNDPDAEEAMELLREIESSN